jgi:DNA-binding response OmpR family regulator
MIIINNNNDDNNNDDDVNNRSNYKRSQPKGEMTREAAATTSSSSSSEDSKNRKKKILVVDDEPDIIFTIKAILKENGFEVDSFDDAPLALENFTADTYGVAVLDIKMPKMNGFELCGKLKIIDNKVKVIFLTALTDLEGYNVFKKEVSPRWGNRHFIHKPIENENLLDQVNFMMTMYSNDAALA